MNAGDVLRIAHELKRKGQLEKAIAQYRQGIQLNYKFSWFYHNIGEILEKQGYLEEAISEYRSAIQLKPDSVLSYLRLGKALTKQGNLHEALQTFKVVFTIRPDLLYHYFVSNKLGFLFTEFISRYSIEFLLSENQQYTELTNQSKWVTVSVEPKTSYRLIGKLKDNQKSLSRKAIIQFEFLDEKEQLLPMPYPGTGNSPELGSFLYISSLDPSLSQYDGSFFRTPEQAHYARFGFQAWQYQDPIFIESKLKLEIDLFDQLTQEKIVQSKMDYCLIKYNLFFKPNQQSKFQNDNQEAKIIEDTIEYQPNYSEFYDHLGNLFLEIKKTELAISAYRKASQLSSNYSFPNSKLKQLYNVQNLNDWAIGEDLFLYILETLPLGATILELGSGSGTNELSKYYNIISIEHNEEWLNKYNSRYIYAPLINNFWYDSNIISRELTNVNYDLLLIDGPPGYRRAGILENLHLFNWSKIVIFDDINRKKDREVMLSIAKYIGKNPQIYKFTKDFAVFV